MDRTAICPGCGKDVTIPVGLDACYCVFCGERVELPVEVIIEDDGPRPPLDLPPLVQALNDLVVADRNMSKEFGPKTYPEQFRNHQIKLSPLLTTLDESLPRAGEARRKMLQDAADGWLDLMAQRWGEENRSKKKGVQPHYADQLLMAAYTLPALRDLPRPSGEEFARTVQQSWVARWPETPIALGSYEELMGGFRKKLCFITTAVCRQQGKPDDCYELTAFRRFRDREMLTTAEGQALVEEYYQVAPAIVSSVALCWDGRQVYDDVYRRYLLPCLEHIEAGEHAACRDKYVEMVRFMEKTYLPS